MILDASWSFDLSNYGPVWNVMSQIGILLIGLFLGNLLRNVVPFLKKSLIPASLLGGLLILVLQIILKNCGVTYWNGLYGEGGTKTMVEGLVDRQVMQVITYHGLGIGFVAMSLKIADENKTKTKGIHVIQQAAITGGTYMLQAFLGLGITILMFVIGGKIYQSSGLLLPLGYGQGPGNALAWDINFSQIVNDGGEQVFTGNGSVGLSIASIGFIVGSVIGVIYINIFKKRGQINVEERHEVERTASLFESNNEIPDTESVDKFTLQLALVFIAYALAFGIMVIFAKISDFTNGIAWGFNFIWGVLTANLVKMIIKFFKKKGVIKRKYINNYQMDRISGFAFDLMIVAGVAAIEINDIKDYIWPIVILCVVGAIATYIYVRIMSVHCFKGINHEMFVVNYGTLTGTASNGMILLKEIDPNFSTPASNLFILSQMPAMIFVAPLLLLLNLGSGSEVINPGEETEYRLLSSNFMTKALIALGIFFLLFVIYTLFLVISSKKLRAKANSNEEAMKAE